MEYNEMIHLFNAAICYADKVPCIILHNLKQGKQNITLPGGRKVTFYIQLYEGFTYIDNIRTTNKDIPAIIAEKIK